MEKVGVPPVVASDAELLAKVSGAVTTAAGCGLAFGIAPRLNATLLALINLPITMVSTFSLTKNHILSDSSDEKKRAKHTANQTSSHLSQTGKPFNTHKIRSAGLSKSTSTTADNHGENTPDAIHTLLQGAAVAGGLLLAIFDREGKPSLTWRAMHHEQQTCKNVNRLWNKIRTKVSH